MTNKFTIQCHVWGGVTGPRTSCLKHNGAVKVFTSREDAELEAADLNKSANGNPYRTASFAYTVVERESDEELYLRTR